MRVVVVAAVACFAASAAAHITAQEGDEPFVDGSGAVLGGKTSQGIVTANGDHFEAVCDDAAGSFPYFGHRVDDGSLLVGIQTGLARTTDGGCTYDSVSEDLDGFAVSALVEHPDGRLFVLTAGFSAENSIFVSDDDGATFTPVFTPIEGLTLFQLVVSPDGAHMAATGSQIVGQNSVAKVFVSDDGGDSFTDVSAAYADYPFLRAFTVDVDGTSILFGGANADGDGVAIVGGTGENDVPVVIATFPDEVLTAGAVFGGDRYVQVKLLGNLYRQTDATGEFALVTSPSTTPGPTTCLFTKGSKLFGCGRRELGAVGLFMASDDGTTWTSMVAFDDVLYRICPQGTIGFSACAAFFESFCSNESDDDFDGKTDCDDDDCTLTCLENGEGEGEGEPPVVKPGEGEGEPPDGCHCGGTSSTSLMALALLALARRRRLTRGASSN